MPLSSSDASHKSSYLRSSRCPYRPLRFIVGFCSPMSSRCPSMRVPARELAAGAAIKGLGDCNAGDLFGGLAAGRANLSRGRPPGAPGGQIWSPERNSWHEQFTMPSCFLLSTPFYCQEVLVGLDQVIWSALVIPEAASRTANSAETDNVEHPASTSGPP